MNKTVRIGVYRILRKLGASRNEIYPEVKLKNELIFDDQEWNFFLFFIESKFNISLSNSDENKLDTVENTIEIIQDRLIPSYAA